MRSRCAGPPTGSRPPWTAAGSDALPLSDDRGGHALLPGPLRDGDAPVRRLADACGVAELHCAVAEADGPGGIAAAARTAAEVLRIARARGRPAGPHRLDDVLPGVPTVPARRERRPDPRPARRRRRPARPAGHRTHPPGPEPQPPRHRAPAGRPPQHRGQPTGPLHRPDGPRSDHRPRRRPDLGRLPPGRDGRPGSRRSGLIPPPGPPRHPGLTPPNRPDLRERPDPARRAAGSRQPGGGPHQHIGRGRARRPQATRRARASAPATGECAGRGSAPQLWDTVRP